MYNNEDEMLIMFQDIVNEIADPFYVDVDSVGIDDGDYHAYINLKYNIHRAIIDAYNKGCNMEKFQGDKRRSEQCHTRGFNL